MKRLVYLGFIFFLLLSPWICSAATEVSANISVSAIVDSKVDKTLSTVTVSAHETLADPASHNILITIKLVDSGNNPLPNLNVVLSSNRGQVDIIEAVTKIGQDLPYDEMRKDVTDAEGLVSFRISSFIAGQTGINILADQLVTFDVVELQFDPLPSTGTVTVVVTTPTFLQRVGIPKEITLYRPQNTLIQTGETLSKTKFLSEKLINPGTKAEIPFMYFALILVLLILLPIFIVFNFLNLRNVKKMQNQTTQSLQRIEQKEDQFFRR